MPQSLGQIYLHTVFATKNREPLILTPAPPRLHGYLVTVLRELGCPSLATGGVADHVHILHALGRTRSVAWVMEKLKSNSSRWMKEEGAADFWWQPGYAAFSVGRSELERVKRYIHGQREHHREHSFEQELRALCGREPADTAALEEFLRQEPHRGGTHQPGVQPPGAAPGGGREGACCRTLSVKLPAVGLRPSEDQGPSTAIRCCAFGMRKR